MPNQDLLDKTRVTANLITNNALDLLLNSIAPSDLAKFSYIPRLHFATRPNSDIIAFDYAIVSRDHLSDLPSSELFFVLNMHTKRFLMATLTGEPEYLNQLEVDYIENKLIMRSVDPSLMLLRDFMLHVKIHEDEDTLYSQSLESYLPQILNHKYTDLKFITFLFSQELTSN